MEEAGEAKVAMMYPNAMPEIRPICQRPPLEQAARWPGIRDGMLLGLVLITLVRTSEALAGEQSAIPGSPDSKVDNLPRWAPSSTALAVNTDFFKVPALSDIHVFSATDFRPRKHTVFDADPLVSSFNDAPMLRGTTVWQRMTDYRSHDGVRLLTLWHAPGSSVSLQAGKHGDPSLQWTSHLTKRGDSVQGLFDQLFSMSLAHATNSLRNAGRPAVAAVPSTQLPVQAVSAQK
jgi:hypothetical protein